MHIETSRLIIRNLRSTDLHDFHSYRSNPEITRYQSFDIMSLEEAEAFIAAHSALEFGKAGEWVQYAIEKMESGRLIGDCAIKLDEHDPRIAETGITISPLEHKKGYATETMFGILHFLFDLKNVHRVVEIVDSENTASIKLLETSGFRKEGFFLENIFFKGKWGSEYQYAMLKREWEEMVNKTKD